MNTLFWLLVALLISIALVIVLLPLWKKTELQESDVDQRNINISRQRLADLKLQLQNGTLTQEQFDEQYQELELALNEDLKSHVTNSQPGGQGRWMTFVVLLFVPLLSIILYLNLGETQALEKAEQQQQMREKQAENQQNINNMVAGLAARLQQQPDDAKGWVMLGRSYKYMEQYGQAAQAFKQAHQLLGNDVEVMLQYADSLTMVRGGKLSGEPAELVFKALTLSPDNVTGLWLAGLAKAEVGEFAEALQYWQKLEPLVRNDSKSHQELTEMMTALKSRLGSDPIQEKVPLSKEEPISKSVEVTASLDKALQDQVQKTDTVFIYAQALNGPKMPLAIIRKQVSDLPLTVVLNDAMAMMPAMKLSSFKQVKIIARISKSGTAMQQSGDLIGFVEIPELNAKSSVDVTINQKVE